MKANYILFLLEFLNSPLAKTRAQINHGSIIIAFADEPETTYLGDSFVVVSLFDFYVLNLLFQFYDFY